MGKLIDLTGQKYKSWIVISRAENYQAPGGGHSAQWLCRCKDCGAEKTVVGQVLKSGQIGICECHVDIHNLTGKRFGKAIAIKRVEDHISSGGLHSVQWLCRCDCGKEFITRACCLKNGSTTSCGCNRGRDITNKRFGRLVAIKKIGSDNKGSGRGCKWLFQCDCGNTVEYYLKDVTYGKCVSCGCREKETQQENKIKPTHGASDTPLYEVWCTIKRRCYNKNSQRYYRYGARGIKMCDEWKNSFEAFQSWAFANGYNEKLTIDRIDNNGDYYPENCRWADVYTQANNKSTNVYLTMNNETHTAAEWSRITGIQAPTIRKRIKKGWSVEDTLTTIPYKGRNNHAICSTSCTQ